MTTGGWASTPANVLTGSLGRPIRQPIEMWDNTLRDGEQAPGVSFTLNEKLELARSIADLGVSGINAGFPAVSADEAEIARRVVDLGLPCSTSVLARLRLAP